MQETERNVNQLRRGTTLKELQEHVNQKIPEVTRNHTANDGKHRDELPQMRRKKAVISPRCGRELPR